MVRLRQNFRADAKFGDGSTADGLRYEALTGTRVSQHSHYPKAVSERNTIDRYLRTQALSPRTREVLTWLRNDLDDAISHYRRYLSRPWYNPF